ncbi:unnamed protein product, partial [Ixodes pacificus]
MFVASTEFISRFIIPLIIILPVFSVSTMKVTIKDRVLYSPCPTIDIPCCSIFSVLKTEVESAAEKIVLVDDRLQLTPAEFFSRAKRYAVGFQA